ncbi:MAG: carboxylating nicotinate-nucleotide diphosphorylase [Wigglesworthia glossinidia]|nr:carboxylating nicotinate-nucleotide diphosphorylase [Wigglesworthia glossinidia]
MNKKQSFIKSIKKNISQSVYQALIEDLGKEIDINFDITTSLLQTNHNVSASVFTEEDGILCGQTWFEEVFQQINNSIKIRWYISDGEKINKNQLICNIYGPVKSILVAERTALNFIQSLSGISTQVKVYTDLLKKTNIKLRDTRKTIPGLRYALKYAVLCGGACNHRLGLFDSILIKDNHIKYAQSITNLIKTAKINYPNLPIETEVENLEEFQEALNARSDIIMLDNFVYRDIIQAVNINRNRAILEVSGNITKDNLLKFASIGIDYISIGKLTKDMRSLNFNMHFD